MAQVVHKEEFIFTPNDTEEFSVIDGLVDRMAEVMKEKGYLVKKDRTTLTVSLYGKRVFNMEDGNADNNL